MQPAQLDWFSLHFKNCLLNPIQMPQIKWESHILYKGLNQRMGSHWSLENDCQCRDLTRIDIKG